MICGGSGASIAAQIIRRALAAFQLVVSPTNATAVAALINCGGSYSSLGTSAAALDLAPGLLAGVAAPPRGQRGLVHEMASRGVPVIHLLHIKGLTLRYGLPWDPMPLPEPEALPFPGPSSPNGALFRLVSLGYLSLLALLVAWPGVRGERTDFR